MTFDTAAHIEWLAALSAEGRAPDLDSRAARLLAHQLELFPGWQRLQGKLPDRIEPGLVRPFPARLFKSMTPATGNRVFSTSGTSSGEPGRVGYSPADMSAMDTVIDINAGARLFPDGPGITRTLVLAPDPDARPQMIMAYGMQRLIDRFSSGGQFLIGNEGLDVPALTAELDQACADDTPLTLIGATFGFVLFADAMIDSGRTWSLPAGSRLMDAGGSKGRSRYVSRREFTDVIETVFGISIDWQVNLLGMTELASQFYDHTVGQANNRLGIKINPPWTRTWAVDPDSLFAVADEERGLLVHLDLANIDHPSFILTEDIGWTTAEGFVIEGRATGSELRGCSLTVEEFSSASR